jgi:hypothetical protein
MSAATLNTDAVTELKMLYSKWTKDEKIEFSQLQLNRQELKTAVNDIISDLENSYTLLYRNKRTA